MTSVYDLPPHQLATEADIPLKHKKKRDQRYQLIERIVKNKEVLFDLATQKRVKHIAHEAKRLNTNFLSIYRALNIYWKFGQDKSALLPSYCNSGGKGTSRKAGEVKRGKPIKSKSGVVTLATGINITEE